MAVSVSITTPILDGVNQGLDLGKLNLLFAKLWKIRSADRQIYCALHHKPSERGFILS